MFKILSEMGGFCFYLKIITFVLMTVKEKKWADYVAKGKTPVQAYLLVYPNAKEKTARNRIGKFLKKEELAHYLKSKSQKLTEITQKKVEEIVTNAIVEQEVGEILSTAKKRWLLAKIASGTFEYERTEITKDGDIVKVMCKPNLMEMMKAIDIDNRMSGDNMTAKSNEQDLNKSKTILIIEDKTNEPNSNK